ncbi:MAG: Re/Si-specific NAD(P)(+) transhydrogenase subunit alpha [Pirellula sp.]|jgi:NAD(P) transhydrogenase subunit alpha|nr:Re/Si-specific NAD(P)(+) transhydrogenase subunit alpha [Pirellula sp.]
MKVGVAKETFPGEKRVALTPASVPTLKKLGLEVLVQAGAGLVAGYEDSNYVDKGAQIVPTRGDVFGADIVLQVRAAGENPDAGPADLPLMRQGQVLVASCDALSSLPQVEPIAKSGVTLFALELIPRITRAQSMDILSSQATIAGYRAVLMAAMELHKIFPMMMTAAGTLSAAKVFVLGAGVAGLQAIATAKKLGAIVYGYDLRPACREQVESLGGKFVVLELDSGGSEDKGGYAKAMDEAFYQRQREELAKTVAQCDVVITTAAIPGKRSPLLVTAHAVRAMQPGSVVVDLAAQRGGNCELTRADERIVDSGVTILGPTNIVSDAAYHASLMFSNNVTKFLQNLIVDGKPSIRMDDEIIRDTLVTHHGNVVHPRLIS